MSESLVEEARAELAECQRLEEHARHRDAPLVAGEYAERASLLTRLADRVEDLERLLQGVGVPKLDHIHAQRQRWPHLHRPEGLHDHVALSPPMDE